MLIHELKTSQGLIDHAHNTHGVIWREFDIKKNNRLNRPSAKKQGNGLTITQTEIVEFVRANQPCRSVDILTGIGLITSSIDTMARILIKKGLIDKDKKTALWFNPQNKPKIISKKTITQRLIDYLKTHKTIMVSDVKHITVNASRALSDFKKQGLVKHESSDHTWTWIGK